MANLSIVYASTYKVFKILSKFYGFMLDEPLTLWYTMRMNNMKNPSEYDSSYSPCEPFEVADVPDCSYCGDCGFADGDFCVCPQCDCADNQPDPQANYDLECGACGWKFDRKPVAHDPMDGEGDPYYASSYEEDMYDGCYQEW